MADHFERSFKSSALLIGFALLFSTAAASQQAPTAAAINACTYPGADGGARVNAASLAAAGSAVEIDVNQSCGTQWTTPVDLKPGHHLKFIEGGIYELAGGNLVEGNNVVDGIGPQVVLRLAANQNSGMWFTADGWGTLTGKTAAGNVLFRNLTIDGNLANAPQGCNPYYLCAHGIVLNSTSTQAPTNIRIENITFQNFYGFPIFIETGTAYYNNIHRESNSGWPEASRVVILNNTFASSQHDAIRIYGFSSTLRIYGNLFLDYADDGSGKYDAVNWNEIDGDPKACTSDSQVWAKDWRIESNYFDNSTEHRGDHLKFAVELFGGKPSCATIDGLVYAHNIHDAEGLDGGTGLSTSGHNVGIIGNIWRNGGNSPRGDRAGIEASLTNSTIRENTIEGAALWAYPSSKFPSTAVTITRNSIVYACDPGCFALGVGSQNTVNVADSYEVSENNLDVSGSECRSNEGGMTIGWNSNLHVHHNSIKLCSGPQAYGLRLNTPHGVTSSGVLIESNTIAGHGSGLGFFDSSKEQNERGLRVHMNHFANVSTPVRSASQFSLDARGNDSSIPKSEAIFIPASPTPSFQIMDERGGVMARDAIPRSQFAHENDSSAAFVTWTPRRQGVVSEIDYSLPAAPTGCTRMPTLQLNDLTGHMNPVMGSAFKITGATGSSGSIVAAVTPGRRYKIWVVPGESCAVDLTHLHVTIHLAGS